jgi:acetyl esterase/lipase
MSAQKIIANLMLKLPAPVLVAMSGGRPVVRDGLTLDPGFQFIAASLAKQPLPEVLHPEMMRAGTDKLVELFGGTLEAEVACAEHVITLEGRAIAARSYRPAKQNPLAPLMVFYHFGGGVVGSMETCHAFCSMLAKIVACPVLSVDYRLAPEHRWPAGLDDAIDAFIWARAHASDFGAPKDQASVGGDSMGGNFSAIIAQEMQRRGLPQPFLQLLIYPATTILEQGGSMQSCADAFPLTARIMDWFMANYLPADAKPEDVRISPALAPSLNGLAPTIMVTAGHDPLRDQGMAYAKALSDAGVRVKSLCFETMAHGFTAYTGGIANARRACFEIARLTAQTYRDLGG